MFVLSAIALATADSQLVSDTKKQNKHVESFWRICLDIGSNPITSTVWSPMPGFVGQLWILLASNNSMPYYLTPAENFHHPPKKEVYFFRWHYLQFYYPGILGANNFLICQKIKCRYSTTLPANKYYYLLIEYSIFWPMYVLYFAVTWE